MNTVTVLLRWTVVVLCAAALAACGRSPPEQPAPAVAASTPAPAATVPPAQRTSPPLIKSTVATYDGTLPCADCDGIQTHLVLQHDELKRNSYVLNETYKGKAPQPFLSAGRWTLSIGTAGDPQVGLVHMDSGRPSDRKTWRIGDNGDLTLVDTAGKPADSSLNYTLQHTGGRLDLHALYEAELAEAASTNSP